MLRKCFLILLFAMGLVAPAQARVTVSFYARELGAYFPHAFFTVKGTLDEGGTPIDASYGFTAANLSPAILTGTVNGKVEGVPAGYVGNSTVHMIFPLADADYKKLMATVAAWSSGAGSRYNLNKHNCVHFIAEAARAVGLDAPDEQPLMKKPRSYLVFVAQRNGAWLAAHHATLSTMAEAAVAGAGGTAPAKVTAPKP